QPLAFRPALLVDGLGALQLFRGDAQLLDGLSPIAAAPAAQTLRTTRTLRRGRPILEERLGGKPGATRRQDHRNRQESHRRHQESVHAGNSPLSFSVSNI